MRQKLLPLLAPAALAALALAQVVLVHTTWLSPWKGGGFGMFSTNDHGAFRTVRVTAVEPGGERRLRVPTEHRRLRMQTREHPTRARLTRLAHVVEEQAPDASAIRIEVWRALFDAGDLRPTHHKVTELVLERGP